MATRPTGHLSVHEFLLFLAQTHQPRGQTGAKLFHGEHVSRENGETGPLKYSIVQRRPFHLYMFPLFWFVNVITSC